MDSSPDPRPDLTAAQRIAIALGTAEDPRTTEAAVDTPPSDDVDEVRADSPA